MYFCPAFFLSGQAGREGKNMKRQVEKLMEEDLDDIPMSYLLYICLGIVAIIASAAILIVRTLQHF